MTDPFTPMGPPPTPFPPKTPEETAKVLSDSLVPLLKLIGRAEAVKDFLKSRAETVNKIRNEAYGMMRTAEAIHREATTLYAEMLDKVKELEPLEQKDKEEDDY